VGDAEEARFEDLIEDKTAEDPSDLTSFNLFRKQLDGVLLELSERERKILELRYGLVDGIPSTLEDVGRKYNVTRERIRQIEAKALRKLRHPPGDPTRGLPRDESRNSLLPLPSDGRGLG